jgi:hypothetical protein
MILALKKHILSIGEEEKKIKIKNWIYFTLTLKQMFFLLFGFNLLFFFFFFLKVSDFALHRRNSFLERDFVVWLDGIFWRLSCGMLH